MTNQPPEWHPLAPMIGADTERPGQGRRLAISLLAASVVALVVAGVLVFVLGNATTAPASTPRTHLERALVATDAAVSADVTMDAKASFNGVSIAMKGSGAVDFPAKTASLHMTAFGQSISLIEAGNAFYVNHGNLLGAAYPGKSWVRVPVSAVTDGETSKMSATLDPQKAMAELVKLGAVITPLGTATIGGSLDEGYKIELSMAALAAHASALPASVRSLFSTSKNVPASAQLTATVYVDPVGRLQAAHLRLSASETGHPVTVTFDLSLSHFGSATVAPPPSPTQTVTYQDVKGSLGGGALPLGAVTGMSGT